MRSSRGLVVGATVAALAFTWGFTSGSGYPPIEKVEKGTQRKEIKLHSVYSTNRQKGLQGVKWGLCNSLDKELEQLHRNSDKLGPSNILMVYGKDIAEAVKATRQAFLGMSRADQPVSSNSEKNTDSIWVAVYLGIDSSTPPVWLLNSVDITGHRVRVMITEPERWGATADCHQYWIWIPLKKVKPGAYELQLLNAKSKDLLLMRRVVVTR